VSDHFPSEGQPAPNSHQADEPAIIPARGPRNEPDADQKLCTLLRKADDAFGRIWDHNELERLEEMNRQYMVDQINRCVQALEDARGVIARYHAETATYDQAENGGEA
jgi:hypothetical protein